MVQRLLIHRKKFMNIKGDSCIALSHVLWYDKGNKKPFMTLNNLLLNILSEKCDLC